MLSNFGLRISTYIGNTGAYTYQLCRIRTKDEKWKKRKLEKTKDVVVIKAIDRDIFLPAFFIDITRSPHKATSSTFAACRSRRRQFSFEVVAPK